MYVEFLPFYYHLTIRLPLLLELLSKSVPVTLAQKSELRTAQHRHLFVYT